MKTRFKIWVKIVFIIIILITTLIIYGSLISPKILDIKKYNVINTKIPDNFNNIKIVQISDIHYKTFIKEKELKKIIKKVNNLKPDIVIISGDILDSSIKYTDKDKNTLIKYLSNIDSNLGNYVVRGDNDTDDIWLEITENSKLIKLENSYKIIYNDYENPILISGLNSQFDDDKLNNIDTNDSNIKFKILVMHEPDYINKITSNNFDLILAGHSLGGQIKIPIIENLFLPTNSKNYYKDYYKLENTDFYISSGLGTTKFKFRLFNNPSINVYTLKNK